jgi:adenylate kinase family enzyme
MEEKITAIKQWLGAGSINIFGLPFSGKDTVGIRLAELIGAKFLSSGLILRSAQNEDVELMKELNAGNLAPTTKFESLVLPYFKREDLQGFPLILSSVGRWEGEEYNVISAAEESGHPIKAALVLNVSEAEIKKRWHDARLLMDRGKREDDRDERVLDNRINEFKTKTMPVIETYHARDLLVPVSANIDRDGVFYNVINGLYEKVLRENGQNVPLNQ